jgi:hypothetical protein
MSRLLNFSDLRINPELWESPPEPDQVGWQIDLGCGPWSMADHFLAHVGKQPCPVCGGRTHRRKGYCGGCDATGLDGKVTFPGLDVDECPDRDWRPEPTVYIQEGLPGGKGRKATGDGSLLDRLRARQARRKKRNA